jgi:MFS family permease
MHIDKQQSGAQIAPARVPFRRGWIYVLMFSLVMINYMDRPVVAIVAQDIKAEFNLTPVQLGYLFSSFLWTYVICLLPVGILLDRYSSGRVNSIGITLWSLAMAATAAVTTFPALLAARLVMGAGEATSIPSCMRIVREWMPARERGVATVVASAGGFIGPAVGAVLIAWLATMWGWRGAFLILAALGFVWLVCNMLGFDRPENARWLSEEERRKILTERSGGTPDEIFEHGRASVIVDLLRSRSVWGAMILQAAAIYTYYLLLFWLPSYLQSTQHLTLMKTGFYTAIPWAVAAPASILLGFLSDRTLNKDALLRGSRRYSVIICTLLGSAVLLVPLTSDPTIILCFIATSLSGLSATISLNVIMITDLIRRPSETGKAASLVILAGNIFGLLAPIITGYIVSALHNYVWAFVVAGTGLLVGAVAVATMTYNPVLSHGLSPLDDSVDKVSSPA